MSSYFSLGNIAFSGFWFWVFWRHFNNQLFWKIGWCCYSDLLWIEIHLSNSLHFLVNLSFISCSIVLELFFLNQCSLFLFSNFSVILIFLFQLFMLKQPLVLLFLLKSQSFFNFSLFLQPFWFQTKSLLFFKFIQ